MSSIIGPKVEKSQNKEKRGLRHYKSLTSYFYQVSCVSNSYTFLIFENVCIYFRIQLGKKKNLYLTKAKDKYRRLIPYDTQYYHGNAHIPLDKIRILRITSICLL